MKYVANSTQGFTWTLAGLKALLEHNVRLNLVADRSPKVSKNRTLINESGESVPSGSHALSSERELAVMWSHALRISFFKAQKHP